MNTSASRPSITVSLKMRPCKTCPLDAVLNPDGEPIARVASCCGKTTINVTFGGPERKTLYVTESATGHVLQAD